MFYKIMQICKNLYNFREIIFNDCWFDYTFLLKALQIKLDSDANNYRLNGSSSESDDIADELEYCSDLLFKIVNHDYYANIEEGPDDEMVHKYRAADKEKQDDINNVFDRIKTRVQSWWD